MTVTDITTTTTHWTEYLERARRSVEGRGAQRPRQDAITCCGVLQRRLRIGIDRCDFRIGQQAHKIRGL